MAITERVTAFLAQSRDDVFLRVEFAGLGGRSQVSQVLKKLCDQGQLVKLGLGVYARAKPSQLSGKPIPTKPLEVLAPLALAKLGIPVRPSLLMQQYNSGLSTQVPAGVAFSTGGRRVTRKLGFNTKLVRFEP